MNSVSGLYTCMTQPPHHPSQVYYLKGKGWFCEEHFEEYEEELE